MPFDDDFDKQFDKQFKRAGGFFVGWFIFCGLMSLATLVFLAWLAVQILGKF